MRALAMTGMVTASWMPLIRIGSDIRATPPSRRMSAGTRSSAMTAAAPASSAIFACSALTTSMMTPPLSISARPLLTRIVPVSCIGSMLPGRLGLARAVFALGLRPRQDVGTVRAQVRALPVREQDAHHRPLLLADDQAVHVDDLGFLVVLPVLGARCEDGVAHLVRIDHVRII